MGIVSHFELIFKPQSPASPPGTAVDRVIQGYFLEITNLEDFQLRFQLEFVAIPPAAGTPNGQFRSLAGNTLVFVDTPGNDDQAGVLNGAPTATSFFPSTGLVTIAPKATALVAVLPSAFGANPLDMTPLAVPNFEVRGYVNLRLPALFSGPFRFPLFRQPQANAPVKVLLTPQNRATFFKADNSISGQTQTTLTVVGGSAQTTVDPEPGGPLRFSQLALADDLVALGALIQGNERLNQPDVLAALLSQIDAGENLAPFNAALAAAGIPFAVEHRKAR